MDGPLAVVDRLLQATNQHDVEALAACFWEDFKNETPTHPSRGFRGREQVRRNLTQIFGYVPDLRADVIRRAVDGNTVWTEWDMLGIRRDGTWHRMTGVVLFDVEDDLIRSARFYLEPVDEGQASVDEAVREQVVRE